MKAGWGFVIKIPNVLFSVFVFFMKWNDKAASNCCLWYSDDAAKHFQGEMHITKWCLSQQEGCFHPYTLQTYKIYICPITSQDIFLVKVYYKVNLSDGRSHRPVNL